MKTTIGRGLVVTALLAAGCGSGTPAGTPGSGGTGGGAAGNGGTAGTTGTAGTGSAGTGGASGTGGSGTAGNGAAGTGTAGGGGTAGSGTAGGGGTSGGGSGGGGNAGTGTGGGGGVGGGVGGTAWLTPPSIPPALAVPAGATLKLHDHGTGAQVYTCTASGGGADAGADAGATTYAWVLYGPDAKLYDATGTQVGTHGVGPNWTSTVDGSVVNGAKVAQVDSPLSDAIPWLLLRASSTTGTGVFSDVTYVQRLSTTLGKAPATGCDSTTVGMQTRVNYTADYYFYTGGGAAAWLTAPPSLPAAIAVPSGTTLELHDHGIGAQVYTCTASAAGGAGGGGGAGGAGGAAATSYAWVLKQPDAILYDVNFAQVGTHGLGPNWTSTVDGSVVNGAKVAQASSPLTDAIPWLLLKASSTSGIGVFSNITYVQRLNTAGGLAPGNGCDATTVGMDTRVAYSADYYFFTGGASADGGTGG